MIGELHEAARHLGGRCVRAGRRPTGEGRSFSAGADLTWMRAQFDGDPRGADRRGDGAGGDARALNELPKPLIGRINGQAFGGGLGLISVCDVAVGSEAARFAFTEARLGLIPATISPYVLARMGEGRARRVFMSARMFGAGEAVDLGLLARAVPADELDAASWRSRALSRLFTRRGGRLQGLARSLGPVIDDATWKRGAAVGRHLGDQRRTRGRERLLRQAGSLLRRLTVPGPRPHEGAAAVWSAIFLTGSSAANPPDVPMSVKYISGPSGIAAPVGSRTPERACEPSMATSTSCGSNCGSAKTHAAPLSRIFAWISAIRWAPGIRSGLTVMEPAAFTSNRRSKY